ncbi:PAS domain-containing sensor histidine kinase [Natrarchaeobius oligotrophus]|uniref:histidine kinase n=1 Tax=Natrarchaeobius chitinivorans TaxID=1679083 RepID=A0A3N6PNN7_NATCH|nr:PAS domain-containing sensor histidine kinase [Natrarchaeobius chitinivorans]
MALETIPLHSTNLLTVLDENGIIQYESPSIERIYGFDQNDLVGEQVADYFHPEDRDRIVEAFQLVVASEEYAVEAVEYRHERADGTYCWVESIASANPTPDGFYVVNTRDISDQREREAELRRKNERLLEFAKIVSHDLRNPLNVAQGSTELARTECESEHLDAIEWAHDRMEVLIDDILTLARTGNQIDDLEPVSLAALTRECWRQVMTNDATLVVETERTIRADPYRLQQLLENLVRNAIEHGGRRTTVTVGDLPNRDGFYVADDGQGIPKSARNAVFETGYSTSENGAGLGLRIVEQIALTHGWDISLTESDAGGARFEFTGVEFDRS